MQIGHRQLYPGRETLNPMHEPFADESPTPPPIASAAAAPPPLPVLAMSCQATHGVTDEDKTLAALCHVLGIFTGFLGPLVIWLVKKDSSPFLDHHGREALNFQLTMLLVLMSLGAVTFVLMFIFVGIFLIPVIIVLQILAIVAEIMAAVAAANGEWHRYPFCIRLV